MSYRYKLCAIGGDPQWGIEAGEAEPPAKGPGLHVAASVELIVTTPDLGTHSHEVHFNRGVTGQRFAHLFPNAKAQGCRQADQWQWLSRGLEEAMLKFIEEAEGPGWQIRGALYEAHYLPVVRALARARDRGVSVSLVVDWKVGYWSEEKKTWNQRGPQHLNQWALEEAGLIKAGCVVHRTRPISAISHNKFFVLVDPADTAVAVWTGSTNLTSGAIFGHSNVGHVIRDPHLCAQYLKYWAALRDDPEKKDLAAFNEQHSPLPVDADGMAALEQYHSLAIFSPRLRWAHALDFFAQLISSAKHCVLFTAAFGISKDVAPALLGNDAVPKYLLLESEGQWAASREAVRELRRRPSVRVAMGTHMDAPPLEASRGGWLPESLTGLNQHVRYVHTKILVIDPFSQVPTVITGSANFSRASMESNDENMIVVRGNTDLADAYAVEFFRIFEHMYFRNQVEAQSKKQSLSDSSATMCKCGEAAVQRKCAKEGPNLGRSFRACCKPWGKGCGFFVWLDQAEDSGKESCTGSATTWPDRCFGDSGFDCMERRALGQLGLVEQDVAQDSAASCKLEPGSADTSPSCDELQAETGAAGEALEAMGVLDDEVEADEASITDALAAMSLSDKEATAHPADLVKLVVQATQELQRVDSNAKGGSKTWRQLRADLNESVVALPEQPARAQTLSLLGEMDRSFVAKTKASWRPFLVQVLATLGGDAPQTKVVA